MYYIIATYIQEYTCIYTFGFTKGSVGHVTGCPGESVFVDMVEHVGETLVVLLHREKIDHHLSGMKQGKV